MSSDLESIKALEKEIGKELTPREYHQLEIGSLNGFAIDGKKRVTGLNLNNLRIDYLPSALSLFQNLEKISLKSCNIKDYHPLLQLPQLKHLYLASNRLMEISFIAGFSGLHTLDLSSNYLEDLSPLAGLKNLVHLNLNSSRLTDVSPMATLVHLSHLELDNNKLEDITPLSSLKRLELLSTRNNAIRELPKELFVYTDEKADKRPGKPPQILLTGNPLQEPPMEIVDKGFEAIKAYFQALEKSDVFSISEIKALLVGDGGAGKTSLVKLLTDRPFDPSEPVGHGVNIHKHLVVTEKKSIHIRYWDFGSLAIMHATHQFFLSKRSVYILVLDGRKDENPEYWFKHIRTFGGDSPIMVVINRIDQNPDFQLNQKFLMEKYPTIQGFYRLSSKKGEGIEELKKGLKALLDKVDILKTTWPKKWFQVKKRLESINIPHLTLEQYNEICHVENLTDETDQDTLLAFLNDLGVVVHFKGFALRNLLVLDPLWITQRVDRILGSTIIAQSKGVLPLDRLQDILNKDSSSTHRFIISLMHEFGICFEIDSDQVIVPDLLAIEEPDFCFTEKGALKFVFRYDFLPKSILPRFMARMHRDTLKNLRWRTGILLERPDSEATALVKVDYTKKEIYIAINGDQRRDYFAVLLHTLRDINGTFAHLAVTELVPMPDAPAVTVSYAQLLRLEKEGFENYFSGSSEKSYSVKELLGTLSKPQEEQDETLQILGNIKLSQIKKKS